MKLTRRRTPAARLFLAAMLIAQRPVPICVSFILAFPAGCGWMAMMERLHR